MLVFMGAPELTVAGLRQAEGLVSSILQKSIPSTSTESFCAALTKFTNEVILPNFISANTGSFEGSFIGTMMQLRDMIVYNHKKLNLPEEGITERANQIIQSACELRDTVVHDGGALSRTVMASIATYDSSKRAVVAAAKSESESENKNAAKPIPTVTPKSTPAKIIQNKDYVQRHSNNFRKVPPVESAAVAASLTNTLKNNPESPDAVYNPVSDYDRLATIATATATATASPSSPSYSTVSPSQSHSSVTGASSSDEGSPDPVWNLWNERSRDANLTGFGLEPQPKRAKRAPAGRKPGVKLGRPQHKPMVNPSGRKIPIRWETWEDNTLQGLKANNPDWSWLELSNGLKAQGFDRGPKQTRERFINHLAEGNNLKGPWNESEDRQLMAMHGQHGNRWTKISTYITGRSEISVKNRFKTVENMLTKRNMAVNLENLLLVCRDQRKPSTSGNPNSTRRREIQFEEEPDEYNPFDPTHIGSNSKINVSPPVEIETPQFGTFGEGGEPAPAVDLFAPGPPPQAVSLFASGPPPQETD